MIKNDQEFQAMLKRIGYFQQQVTKLREVETDPKNYKMSVGAYLAELDRMNLEMRKYQWALLSEMRYAEKRDDLP
ncbi:MAG: hypothetical protein ACKVZH_24330 [Blastocatellia bacterium]